jgi:hypothetical protein
VKKIEKRENKENKENKGGEKDDSGRRFNNDEGRERDRERTGK